MRETIVNSKHDCSLVKYGFVKPTDSPFFTLLVERRVDALASRTIGTSSLSVIFHSNQAVFYFN